MILVDTSVWINHFRHRSQTLARQLENRRVMCHPFIIGELACGSLNNRNEVLRLLDRLPAALEASPSEVMQFVEQYRLMSRGIGWIDMHLLASAAMSSARLWTLDKRLDKVAHLLDTAFIVGQE